MRMNNETYNTLKAVIQIVLPALATFLIAMAKVWGIDILNDIGASITAIVTLGSGLLGASSAIYDKEKGEGEGENGNIN